MAKSREHWIFVRDGKLILHTENADYNFLKHGAEEREREITREQVQRDYPGILAEVDEILAGSRTETDIFY